MVEQHALGEKPRERLVDMHQPHVAHHLGPEARVEQVQDRVLDAADVLVHRHPVIVARIDHRRRIRRGVAHVVPRRIDENVHGVGLALCRLSALWTSAVDEVSAMGERVAAAVRNAILGKDHRQVLLGHRHFAAARAMNDRDRRAPITLSRNAPIAKPVGHALFAESLRREIRGDRVDGLLIAHAVVLARVDQVAADLVFVPGLVRVGRECFAVDRDHLLDRQPVFFRELEIALVVGGHAHHRAVAVAHQHVIADPYLELFTGEWVHDEEAGRQAFLFHGREVRLDDRSALAFLDEGGELRIGSCGMRGQRVLGGHRAEGHAHDGVGAGGEDIHPAVADRLAVLASDVVRERKAHALAPADPVGLHDFHPLGPAGHLVEICQQLFGVLRDAQVIHRDLALLDRCAGAPALAIDHLLVGEHGLVDRIPVDDTVLAVGDAFVEHLQEQPLIPSIVRGRAGREFARPVDRPAHRLALPFHVGDVLVRPLRRRDAVFYRCILGRQAECVPPHGHQRILAVHTQIPVHHVVDGVIAHVPHVQLAGWIRQHGDAKKLGSRRGLAGEKRLARRPVCLRGGFDIGGTVRLHAAGLAR